MKVEFNNKKSEHPVTVTSKIKLGDANPLFVAAAERGLKSSLQSGELGFPVLDVQAVITSITADPERSTEVAFEVAANDAVNKALKGNIVLLEPIMKLVVAVPDEFLRQRYLRSVSAAAPPSSAPNRTAVIPKWKPTFRW